MEMAGPSHHGAIRHAAALAALVESAGVLVVPAGDADLTHAQFSDSLWEATSPPPRRPSSGGQ